MLKFFIITMVNVYITFYTILAGLHLTPFYFCPEYLYFSDSLMWISRSWLWAFKFYVSFIVHEVNIRYIRFCVKLIQINQTMIDWNHNAKLMHISLKVPFSLSKLNNNKSQYYTCTGSTFRCTIHFYQYTSISYY